MNTRFAFLGLASLLLAAPLAIASGGISGGGSIGPIPQPQGEYRFDCEAELSEQGGGNGYTEAKATVTFHRADFEKGAAELEIPAAKWTPVRGDALPENLEGHLISMFFHKYPQQSNGDPQVATLYVAASLTTSDPARLPHAANWLRSSSRTSGEFRAPLEANASFNVGDRSKPSTILVIHFSASCTFAKK